MTNIREKQLSSVKPMSYEFSFPTESDKVCDQILEVGVKKRYL